MYPVEAGRIGKRAAAGDPACVANGSPAALANRIVALRNTRPAARDRTRVLALLVQRRSGADARVDSDLSAVESYARGMTIVLCCATPKFLLQASDRQLTYPNGRVADDVRNKAVFATGRMVWAYTGIARIGVPARPTDEWLVDVLASADDAMDANRRIRETATRAVRGVHGPAGYTAWQRRVLRRLAFVCSFYADQRLTDAGGLEAIAPIPVIEVISNFASQDAQGSLQWLSEAVDRFSTWTIGPVGEGTTPRVLEFGQYLTASARVELHRLLRRCDRHDTGVEAYARVLARAVQRCHDEGNAFVGRNVMVAWMARDAAPGPRPDGVLYDAPLVPLLENPGEREFFQRPQNETSTGRGYFYLPGDRQSRAHYAPSWLGDGIAMIGMEMTHQGPGGQVAVTSLARVLPPQA